jgi:hypothetical protein
MLRNIMAACEGRTNLGIEGYNYLVLVNGSEHQKSLSPWSYKMSTSDAIAEYFVGVSSVFRADRLDTAMACVKH